MSARAQPRRRVRVRLERQPDAVRSRGRNDRQPSEFPRRRIYFLDEAQELRVELEGLGLIVYASRSLHRSRGAHDGNLEDGQEARRILMSANSGPGFKKHPNHRITAKPAGVRVQVKFKGELIADTKDAVRLEEATYTAVYYIPRKDVKMERLVRERSGKRGLELRAAVRRDARDQGIRRVLSGQGRFDSNRWLARGPSP